VADLSNLAQTVADLAQAGQGPALPILFGSAMLEYIFPPFPGDTVTLAGAVLARAGQWSYWWVFVFLTAGSVAGSMAAWWVGARGLPQARLERWFGGNSGALDGIERVMAGFRRWGPAFLMVNRFMPGVRAFFFVAAGIAKLPAHWVALYSAVSAAAWNALLMLAGYFIGDNLDQLQSLLSTYIAAVWVILGVVALWALAAWWRRRSSRSAN